MSVPKNQRSAGDDRNQPSDENCKDLILSILEDNGIKIPKEQISMYSKETAKSQSALYFPGYKGGKLFRIYSPVSTLTKNISHKDKTQYKSNPQEHYNEIYSIIKGALGESVSLPKNKSSFTSEKGFFELQVIINKEIYDKLLISQNLKKYAKDVDYYDSSKQLINDIKQLNKDINDPNKDVKELEQNLKNITEKIDELYGNTNNEDKKELGYGDKLSLALQEANNSMRKIQGIEDANYNTTFKKQDILNMGFNPKNLVKKTYPMPYKDLIYSIKLSRNEELSCSIKKVNELLKNTEEKINQKPKEVQEQQGLFNKLKKFVKHTVENVAKEFGGKIAPAFLKAEDGSKAEQAKNIRNSLYDYKQISNFNNDKEMESIISDYTTNNKGIDGLLRNKKQSEEKIKKRIENIKKAISSKIEQNISQDEINKDIKFLQELIEENKNIEIRLKGLVERKKTQVKEIEAFIDENNKQLESDSEVVNKFRNLLLDLKGNSELEKVQTPFEFLKPEQNKDNPDNFQELADFIESKNTEMVKMGKNLILEYGSDGSDSKKTESKRQKYTGFIDLQQAFNDIENICRERKDKFENIKKMLESSNEIQTYDSTVQEFSKIIPELEGQLRERQKEQERIQKEQQKRIREEQERQRNLKQIKDSFNYFKKGVEAVDKMSFSPKNITDLLNKRNEINKNDIDIESTDIDLKSKIKKIKDKIEKIKKFNENINTESEVFEESKNRATEILKSAEENLKQVQEKLKSQDIQLKSEDLKYILGEDFNENPDFNLNNFMNKKLNEAKGKFNNNNLNDVFKAIDYEDLEKQLADLHTKEKENRKSSIINELKVFSFHKNSQDFNANVNEYNEYNKIYDGYKKSFDGLKDKSENLNKSFKQANTLEEKIKLRDEAEELNKRMEKFNRDVKTLQTGLGSSFNKAKENLNKVSDAKGTIETISDHLQNAGIKQSEIVFSKSELEAMNFNLDDIVNRMSASISRDSSSVDFSILKNYVTSIADSEANRHKEMSDLHDNNTQEIFQGIDINTLDKEIEKEKEKQEEEKRQRQQEEELKRKQEEQKKQEEKQKLTQLLQKFKKANDDLQVSLKQVNEGAEKFGGVLKQGGILQEEKSKLEAEKAEWLTKPDEKLDANERLQIINEKINNFGNLNEKIGNFNGDILRTTSDFKKAKESLKEALEQTQQQRDSMLKIRGEIGAFNSDTKFSKDELGNLIDGLDIKPDEDDKISFTSLKEKMLSQMVEPIPLNKATNLLSENEEFAVEVIGPFGLTENNKFQDLENYVKQNILNNFINLFTLINKKEKETNLTEADIERIKNNAKEVIKLNHQRDDNFELISNYDDLRAKVDLDNIGLFNFSKYPITIEMLNTDIDNRIKDLEKDLEKQKDNKLLELKKINDAKKNILNTFVENFKKAETSEDINKVKEEFSKHIQKINEDFELIYFNHKITDDYELASNQEELEKIINKDDISIFETIGYPIKINNIIADLDRKAKKQMTDTKLEQPNDNIDISERVDKQINAGLENNDLKPETNTMTDAVMDTEIKPVSPGPELQNSESQISNSQETVPQSSDSNAEETKQPVVDTKHQIISIAIKPQINNLEKQKSIETEESNEQQNSKIEENTRNNVAGDLDNVNPLADSKSIIGCAMLENENGEALPLVSGDKLGMFSDLMDNISQYKDEEDRKTRVDGICDNEAFKKLATTYNESSKGVLVGAGKNTDGKYVINTIAIGGFDIVSEPVEVSMTLGKGDNAKTYAWLLPQEELYLVNKDGTREKKDPKDIENVIVLPKGFIEQKKYRDLATNTITKEESVKKEQVKEKADEQQDAIETVRGTSTRAPKDISNAVNNLSTSAPETPVQTEAQTEAVEQKQPESQKQDESIIEQENVSDKPEPNPQESISKNSKDLKELLENKLTEIVVKNNDSIEKMINALNANEEVKKLATDLFDIEIINEALNKTFKINEGKNVFENDENKEKFTNAVNTVLGKRRSGDRGIL